MQPNLFSPTSVKPPKRTSNWSYSSVDLNDKTLIGVSLLEANEINWIKFRAHASASTEEGLKRVLRGECPPSTCLEKFILSGIRSRAQFLECVRKSEEGKLPKPTSLPGAPLHIVCFPHDTKIPSLMQAPECSQWVYPP